MSLRLYIRAEYDCLALLHLHDSSVFGCVGAAVELWPGHLLECYAWR